MSVDDTGIVRFWRWEIAGEVRRMPTIDFAELRRRVPIARVLELVAFRPLRRSGAELRGPCPIHRAASPRSRSFAANVRKNVFHCFHCGAAGNALDLYAAVRRTNIYRAAVELCERQDIELPERKASFNPKPAATALRAAGSDQTAAESAM